MSSIRQRVAVIGGLAAYLALLGIGWQVLIHWAPEQMAFTVLGHGVKIADLRHKVVSHGLELGLLIPSVLAIELAVTGWTGSSLRRLLAPTPSSLSDAASVLMWQTRIMSALIVLATFGAALLSGVWLHDRLVAMTGLSLSAASWPRLVQVPILFLVFTFFDYWNHRIDHSHYFWPLHRFHHSADDFCVLTAVRTHPAMFTGVITAIMPAVVLGASPRAIIDLTVLTALVRYVIHSRIDSDFGWIGRYVVQSPTHHRLHHILDISEAPVGHFSLAPIWDHLFGTWRGAASQSLVIGVDTPYRHGAWIGPDLWRDYAEFWRELWRGLRPVKFAPRPAPASTPS